MEIINQSKKPLSVPLPAGKRLFLGPGKSGQVTRKAAESSAVLKLIESGEVKIAREGAGRKLGKGVSKILTDAPGYTGSKYSDH